MRTYEIKTLGCKANLLDSQLLEAELQRQGWTPFSNEGPLAVCIVNSCSVTDEADRQSRKMASKLSRLHPEAAVVVTGCSAEIDPERLSKSPGIDYVIGNRDKAQLVELISQKISQKTPLAKGEVLGGARGYEEILSRHPLDREWPALETAFSPSSSEHAAGSHAIKTRAFLKIQEGCNHFCTYCIIPYGRGPSRSGPSDAIVSEVRRLVESGTREVVITGTNIGDYLSDEGLDHVGLMKRILQETKLERLRLSSLDPVEITPELLELMRTEERLCPHFHVSLQSPHPRILKLMKRKYSFAEVKKCLEAIANIPRDVFVGMDVITGFPGETLEDFEWTRDALKALPWSRLHVFPYSEREGTPATRLPQAVAQAERVRRSRVLNELSFERVKAHYLGVFSKQATLEHVLLERPRGGWQTGYTPHYLRVTIPASEHLRNELVSVRLEHIEWDRSSGEAFFQCVLTT